MAIDNKDKGQNQKFPKLLLSNGIVPIVTTDEVATEIQLNEYGITGSFTSLTNHYCSKSCSSQVIS